MVDWDQTIVIRLIKATSRTAAPACRMLPEIVETSHRAWDARLEPSEKHQLTSGFSKKGVPGTPTWMVYMGTPTKNR